MFKTFLQISAASIVMGALVWYINIDHHFAFAILVGAITYIIMLFATRAVTKKQLKEALLILRR